MGGSKIITSRFRTKSDHSLDAKGRLNFPSRFREVLAQYGSETLMVTTWKSHLRAYPVSEWEAMEDKLIDQGKNQPGLVGFIRMVLSMVVACNLDKQGRILLPSTLRTAIPMGKDVVLTGMRDWVEIWDKDAWFHEVQSTRENFDDYDEALAALGIL